MGHHDDAGKSWPDPVDTSNIEIPPELENLIDLLARNSHESWAKERVDKGWKWGEKRNDALKFNPLLLPFDYISQRDKTANKADAAELIKVLLALGYMIDRTGARTRNRSPLN